MRKISIDGVRDDFRKQLSDLSDFHDKTVAALSSDRDISRMHEYSLMAVAVAWEGYVSDMFIAMINRRPDRFKQHLEDAFRQKLGGEGKPKEVFDFFGSLDIGKHLSKDQVQMFADNVGNNITFPNYEDLKSRAKSWLVEEDQDMFTSQHSSKRATVDALIAIRNQLAHRSERSHKAMNESLRAGALHQTGLQLNERRVNSVGVWLKSRQGNKGTRLNIIATTLGTIAASI